MKLAHASAYAAFTAGLMPSCYIQKTSQPADISVDVAFPSTAAAVLTDTVDIFVFDGVEQCTDLIQTRQTQGALPPSAFESPALTPCQLLENQGNTFSLEVGSDYTMVAVGQIGGSDVFIGCAVQHTFGQTAALSIPVTFIDNTKSLGNTNCTKLSDKCDNACQ